MSGSAHHAKDYGMRLFKHHHQPGFTKAFVAGFCCLNEQSAEVNAAVVFPVLTCVSQFPLICVTISPGAIWWYNDRCRVIAHGGGLVDSDFVVNYVAIKEATFENKAGFKVSAAVRQPILAKACFKCRQKGAFKFRGRPDNFL